MHTSTDRPREMSRWLLTALVATIAIVAALAIRGAYSGLQPGEGDASIPADVRALATEITPVSPAGSISADEAIAAFERAMGRWDGAEITTYLVRMTSPELPALKDRAVWVVKYDGVQVPFSIPDIPHDVERSWPNGTPTAGEVIYAFVDAETGEWLAATTP